MFLANKVK